MGISVKNLFRLRLSNSRTDSRLGSDPPHLCCSFIISIKTLYPISVLHTFWECIELFPNIAVSKPLVMKKILLIIGFQVMGILALAQGYNTTLPDSLSQQLRQAQGQNLQRVEALSRVCDYFFQREQFSEAQPFVNEIIELDSLLNDNTVSVMAQYYHGNLKLGKNDLEAAMPLLLDAENTVSMLRNNETNQRLHVRTLISLGVCYFKCQLVPDAYDCFQKGLELNAKLNDSELNAMLRTNISQVYLNMNNIHKALEINKELLTDDRITPQRKCSPCISIGNLYIDLKEYDSAQFYLDVAEDYSYTLQDKIWIIMLKSKILSHTDRYDEAITMQQKGLDLLANYPNPELEVPLLFNTARCYYLKEDYNKAMEYADSTIAAMNSNPGFFLNETVYKLKANILEKQSNYQEALEQMKIYMALKDSLSMESSMSHLYEMELQRNVKKAEEHAKIEQFAVKLQYQRKLMLLLITLVILASVVAVVLLLLKRKNILIQNKQMKEELLSKELDQRNRELTAKALGQASEGKSLEDFDYYFVQTHPDFYEHLRTDFPNLTPYELRLCAYLKLNLSTKDIATINNISFDSARVARYRLRKTLGITGSDENLVQFLSKY